MNEAMPDTAVGGSFGAHADGAGDGILALEWPCLSPETTAAATKATKAATREARQVGGGSWEGRRLLLVTLVPVIGVVASATAKANLDEELRRAEKDLDPRRIQYLLNRANPKESEREDEEDVKEQEQEEGQGSLHGGQGFQLHSLFYPVQQQTAALLSYFSSSSAATASSSEYARFSEQSLGCRQFGLQQEQQPPPKRSHSSRYGLRGFGGGEIVEVQGGHIVRSTGRKDRHSKVCTAKGPRDRRVRLAAHTAIQFYDVQDRLGYDRPSKAVDWLIKNAKASIDELAELPAWTPTATGGAAAATASSSHPPPPQLLNHSSEQYIDESNQKAIQVVEPIVSAGFSFSSGCDVGAQDDPGSVSFLPPSLDSDSIADTIKSFFPMAAAAATSTSSSPMIRYQSYQQDLLSRTPSRHQDLRLSLQSFQDAPVFHNLHSSHQSSTPSAHNALFPGSSHLSYDAASASWAEQSQRMVPWNVADASGGGSGYVFSLPPTPSQQAVPLHSVLGQGQLFSQRGPLQSSNSPSARAWAVDPGIADNQIHSMPHPAMSSIGFSPGVAFSGFRIPARIQGEEEHDGVTNKPHSASSVSRH